MTDWSGLICPWGIMALHAVAQHLREEYHKVGLISLSIVHARV